MPRNSEYITNLGVREQTLDKLSQTIPLMDLKILLTFLRSDDPVSAIAKRGEFLMTDSAFTEVVKSTLQTHARRLFTEHVLPHQDTQPSDIERGVLERQLGSPPPFWAVDSAPFRASKSEPLAAYNGHYKMKIVKYVFVVNLRGFFVGVDGPFSGTKYDKHLLDASVLKDLITQQPFSCLGDLHFKGTNIVNQYPTRDLQKLKTDPEDTMSEFNAASLLSKLKFNERHGFIRARIEHCFGDGVLGRFRRLRAGRFKSCNTHVLLILFACAVCNLEAMIYHGPGGRITPINGVWEALLLVKTNKMRYQRERHPELFTNDSCKKRKRKVAKVTATATRVTTPAARIGTLLRLGLQQLETTSAAGGHGVAAAVVGSPTVTYSAESDVALSRVTSECCESDDHKAHDTIRSVDHSVVDGKDEQGEESEEEDDEVSSSESPPRMSFAEVRKLFPPNTLPPQSRRKRR